jgi:putative tricarboxylic transport membrane protein
MSSDVPVRQSRYTRVPRDVAAGAFLIIIAALGYAGVAHLDVGQASGVGAGLVPKGVLGLIAVFGVFIALIGMTTAGERMERWSIRGPVFVLGAVVVFAATIRTLGLAVAGPIAVGIASLADKETRPLEVLVFAISMTLLCIGLFKYILRLPIPLLPILIGY